MPPKNPWTRSNYGDGLIRFLVFLAVDLQISQRAAKKLINQFFGFHLSGGSAGRLKKTAAGFYKSTYNQIFQNLVQNPLVHVDETKVSLNGRSEYVWVLANHEDVAYFVSESREGEKVQDILNKFKGILVSDFYSLYDSFECPQQKCLIHLLRDLNDDFFVNPLTKNLSP